MKVKISDIAIINRQRKERDMSRLKELAESIQSIGLLHPPVVRFPFPDEDAKGLPYVLCVGGGRLAAHMFLGLTEIEVNLKEDLDPISAEIAELDENVKRQDLTWQEALAARQRIAELRRQQSPSITVQEIADEIGITQGQLSNDLILAARIKADPSLKGASSKGSAQRAAEFKAHIARKNANLTTALSSDLSSKLFTADGREFVRRQATNSVDLVFCDLPYGIDFFETSSSASATTKGHYDDSAGTAQDFVVDVIPQCLRVLKPSGWAVFFMCYERHAWLQRLIYDVCSVHHDYWDEKSNPRRCLANHRIDETCSFYRPEPIPWIWTRRGAGSFGHYPDLHAANRFEMIVVVNGGEAKLLKKPVENVLDYAPVTQGDRLHAMQKPMELCQEIISRTTVVGDLVLDICMGSGAHLAAAASLGRDFIGCDKNPDNLPNAMHLVGQHYNASSAAAVLRGRQGAAREETAVIERALHLVLDPQ